MASGAGGTDSTSGWPVGLLCQLPLPRLCFGPLFLLSQPGTWLLSVLVSASPFLCAQNLAPSACLALWVWLGLLALSLYPKLFDHLP